MHLAILQTGGIAMKVFKFCKRNLAVILAVIIGSAGALWTGITWDHVQETQMEIAKQVIRFHVLANSDGSSAGGCGYAG